MKRDIIMNLHNLYVNYPSFLSGFNEAFNLLDRLSKNTRISNSMKIHPLRAE